jgi:pimeloyl-ACP methyl ester carboxylesterase
MAGSNQGSPTDEAHLPQGTVRYRDTGTGEPILFIHGYLVDSRLWGSVPERLADGFRCIVPDWPMGSHAVPMSPSADLSPPGIADLIADFIGALDLEAPTVVGNDTGGAISQILATRHPDLVGRLVLTNCDTHDNFPPFPFNGMPLIARIPGGMTLLALPFRVGAVRRGAYGMFAKHPIPADLVDGWLAPSLRSDEIKRDLTKVTAGIHKRYTIEAAEKLRSFERPTLLAWAPEDRAFKLSYAERLAEAIPDARLETIPDAKTFVPLDQPQRLAELIREFVRESSIAEVTR